ncbi:glyoxalase [Sphingomonas sp. BK235]|uniref:glyoxalase n=1 Tax=Sphingomonas sp. BK235 TaxID=2512131 RepID=UPI001049B65F|nr:glyoxalase [Sphingomonas sp. BK235]
MKRVTLLLVAALVGAAPAVPGAAREPVSSDFAMGPQYDTTHVYVPVADFDAFIRSFIATFGGKANPGGVFQVTPTPSQTRSQVVVTPAGSVSVFGFETPIPYPFGEERVGYLVKDMDGAVAAARAAGATRVVETFPDPIGRDTLVRWPGGSVMQLYWHTKTPSYPAATNVPESRLYLTADTADAYVVSWTRFAHATVVSDDRAAPGEEIGRPGKPYRRIRLSSGFGKTTLIVTDGALPWPYGRELTGYEVADLQGTLAKAQAAGVKLLVPTHTVGGRSAAMVQFPGGYIAELHSIAAR